MVYIDLLSLLLLLWTAYLVLKPDGFSLLGGLFHVQV